jgi:hypothetical protein
MPHLTTALYLDLVDGNTRAGNYAAARAWTRLYAEDRLSRWVAADRARTWFTLDALTPADLQARAERNRPLYLEPLA